VLNAVLLAGWIAVTLLVVTIPFVAKRPLATLTFAGILLVIVVISTVLMRRGHVRVAGGAFTGALWLLSTAWMLIAGGVSVNISLVHVLITMIAGLVLGIRAGMSYAASSSLAGLGMLYLELTNRQPKLVPFTSGTSWVVLTVCMIATVVILYLSSRNLNTALDNARRTAAELAAERAHLEQTVAERTRELEQRNRYLQATTLVTQRTGTLLNLDELLPRTVRLINDEFGFYHVSIFMLEDVHGAPGEYAVLRASSSDLLQSEIGIRRQRVGQEGIVGHVAGSGKLLAVTDTQISTIYLPSPALPETRSELALPLLMQDKIVGVLDVQSREPAAFAERDIQVLQTLANQIALAISNAQLFEQAQVALEAERRAYGEVGRQAWTDLTRAQTVAGYRYKGGEIAAITSQAEQLKPDDSARLELAVKVRDQIIARLYARPGSARPLTSEEAHVLQDLADQLGVALESARLYQDTQRRAAREQLTGAIAARMRETLDMDTVLQTAARELEQAMSLHDVTIRLQLGGNHE